MSQLSLAETREKEEMEGQGAGFEAPSRGFKSYLKRSSSAEWDGVDQAQGSCLRVPKAPARYYDLPPPQLSRVMLWWSEAFWKVAAATKRQDCAEERWQEPPFLPPSAPLRSLEPPGRRQGGDCYLALSGGLWF